MKLYKVDIKFYSMQTEVPSSYTIFGALSWAYRILFGEKELEEFLKQFELQEKPILISSLLPNKGGEVLFPKPILRAVRDEKYKDIDFKQFKKIRYIPFKILKEVLDAKIKDELQLNLKLLEEKAQSVSFLRKTAVAHVSLNRITSTIDKEAGLGLFFEESFYIDKASFFILVKEALVDKIKACFKVIEDLGLGGNRSVGFGRVKLSDFEEFPDIEKYISQRTDTFITLSPTIPDQNIDYKNSYFDYLTFRGAVDNNYDFKQVDIWKDKVFYLREGSVLKAKKPSDFYGMLVKTTKEGKSIYQYGLAFPLYIQGGA